MSKRTRKRIHEGTTYPTDYVIAVLDGRTEADGAAEALRAAALPDAFCFHGTEGLAGIQEHAKHEGVLHRAWEALADAGSETGEYHQEYLDHLRQGHSVVCVHASKKEEAERARDVLANGKAYAIRHFGRWVVRDLSGTRATI